MKTSASEPVVGATTESEAQPEIGGPTQAFEELKSDSRLLDPTTEAAADASLVPDAMSAPKADVVPQTSLDDNQGSGQQHGADAETEVVEDLLLTKVDPAEDLGKEFVLEFVTSRARTSSRNEDEWQVPNSSSPEIGEKIFKDHTNKILSTVEILRCLRAFEATFGKYPHCALEDIEHTTAESQHMVATILSLEYYQKCMEEICALKSHYVSPESLRELHCIVRKSAVGVFESIPKTENAQLSEIMLHKLCSEIEKSFSRFHVHNETKRMVQTLRTPLFLSSSVAAVFSLSQTMTMVGLGLLADFFFLVGGFLLLAVLTWIYTRASGDLQELGDSIDDGVNRAWEEILWQVEKLMIKCCFSLGPVFKTAEDGGSSPTAAVSDQKSKAATSE